VGTHANIHTKRERGEKEETHLEYAIADHPIYANRKKAFMVESSARPQDFLATHNDKHETVTIQEDQRSA